MTVGGPRTPFYRKFATRFPTIPPPPQKKTHKLRLWATKVNNFTKSLPTSASFNKILTLFFRLSPKIQAIAIFLH